MPSTEQLRSRLLKKLSELFQLDQPDLDFGFYRIMHAKAQEVQDFIAKDLLKIVEDAFGEQGHVSSHQQIEKAKQKVIATLGETAFDNDGVLNTAFAQTPAAKEYIGTIEKIKTSKDNASAEADVYDHLYRFFERYYDDGDFISRRYYTRETSGKAAPFAVPYNGEEVKLHWANADQYYIKSAEYFSNYTFDLTQAAEIRQMTEEERSLKRIPASPFRVHFRVVDATEGEHGNVKASEANKRFFILHAENPVALTGTGELVVNFEYRPDPEKTGQESIWRDKCNAEAIDTVLKRLSEMAAAGGEKSKEIATYLNLLQIAAPTDTDKRRPVLAKYVNQYTARNTMDYFIHKDLGGFLLRELDFYIKNEVMRLDDIENAEAPAVESYLAKIKVLRKIAGKLIDFLAQLEDFQKKLLLKKKFIIETNYCITLDRVPDELYPEISANDEQCEEWIKLFAIDEVQVSTSVAGGRTPGATEIQADLHNPGFSRPLTVEFLKANNKLVLDTRFFDDSFKAGLVASIESFDEHCDGLLIHSENFQALNLLNGRYRDGIKCVYFDPPYNTGDDGFVYKDSYQSSSWASMMNQVVQNLYGFLQEDGSLFANCDENEFLNFGHILQSVFDKKNHVETITWNKRVPKNDKGIGNIHEYIYLFAKSQKARRSNERGFVMRKDALEEIYEIVKKEKSKGSDLVTAQKALKKFYKKQGFDRGISLYWEPLFII
jgi:adenine-specific DNA-methyltransferase